MKWLGFGWDGLWGSWLKARTARGSVENYLLHRIKCMGSSRQDLACCIVIPSRHFIVPQYPVTQWPSTYAQVQASLSFVPLRPYLGAINVLLVIQCTKDMREGHRRWTSLVPTCLLTPNLFISTFDIPKPLLHTLPCIPRIPRNASRFIRDSSTADVANAKGTPIDQ